MRVGSRDLAGVLGVEAGGLAAAGVAGVMGVWSRGSAGMLVAEERALLLRVGPP